LNLGEQAKGPFLNPVEMNNASEMTTALNLQPEDYIDLENFMLTLTDGYF
jgi:cytochrome c peroxidase